jgi:two-component system, chemotaxis family, chemotaxis protein CheV
MANNGILLESGTNEVEILEFVVGDQPFGVNVLKIQAIEQYDPSRVTQIQLSHPSVVGTLLFRESCITLIDLSREMDDDSQAPGSDNLAEIAHAVESVISPEMVAASQSDQESVHGQNDPTGNKLTLVMEFNNMKTAFLVDGVNRIHRISWESIKPLSPFLASTDSKFTGSMQIEDREILIVDMEKVVTEILPKGQNQFSVPEAEGPMSEDRAAATIFLAEDSPVIRTKVREELARANYTDLRTFPNGLKCLEAITELKEQAQAEGRSINDMVGGLISDIEMPAMDGLALCKKLKQDPGTKSLPVIMFSSLINEQIARKCEDVGSDAYISKPQFTELVGLLDSFVLNRESI